MPIPRQKPPRRKHGWRKKSWRPEYLPAAMAIFTPFDPCANFPKGSYHCVNQEDITAEEVVSRKGGKQ